MQAYRAEDSGVKAKMGYPPSSYLYVSKSCLIQREGTRIEEEREKEEKEGRREEEGKEGRKKVAEDEGGRVISNKGINKLDKERGWGTCRLLLST